MGQFHQLALLFLYFCLLVEFFDLIFNVGVSSAHIVDPEIVYKFLVVTFKLESWRRGLVLQKDLGGADPNTFHFWNFFVFLLNKLLQIIRMVSVVGEEEIAEIVKLNIVLNIEQEVDRVDALFDIA